MERGANSGPIRTCVGCRKRAAQRSLLRVAACEGRAVPDAVRRCAGRGAYLHYRESCARRAIDRGGLARSLREPSMVVDVNALLEAIADSKRVSDAE